VERERSAAATMLGLPGFVVLAVSDYAGELEQAIETTADVVGCPECGVVASSVEQFSGMMPPPPHVVYGPQRDGLPTGAGSEIRS